YVSVGRIRWRPRFGFVPLLLGSQLGYMPEQPVFLLHHFRTTICVHDRKVPSRHDLFVESFGGIPIWRDVAFRSLKDHQRLGALGKVSTMWIGTRKVAFDDAARPIVLKYSR